jgi:serine/threonine protein kinase/tetratricopeptide (TPR) repeat protein
VTLEPGARLGPYEIGVLLGQGGMGDVYRATDVRVGRTVAIKVLPPAAAAQPDRRQRFEREARAVARLNHPHICTLYDVGRQDGIEFLVMEYLDGETLGARLARGPLPLAEALTHAAALAQALARAHREGITHRDIKPSNVMLTESGVKLLDFGLAKLRERDGGMEKSPLDDLSTGLALSPEGTLVGTIAYMSPEQLEGRPVDSRTDIYALGLLIYEMVTGHRAFVKGSQAGLIAAILTEDPAPMAAIQPQTPAPVERIVGVALAKDPNKRWQDAGDLARELAWAASSSHTTTVDNAPLVSGRGLRAWALPAVAAAFIIAALGAAGVVWDRNPTFAVPNPNSTIRNPESAMRSPQSAIRNFVILPCRATSDAMAQAYCDGLTDTLSAKMTPLAVARGLQVTSTLEVRRRGVTDASQARRDFGATLVLEGSILRGADSVRVNYVLVDTATLKQIDAYSSTAAAADAFGLQDRVANWAASALALKLSTGERQTLVAAAPGAPAALELFLEGRGYLLNYQVPGNIDRAIALFDRAIALDPRYAPAYSGLGAAYWQKYEASPEPARVQQARAACAQAVALDAELSGSHICLGTIALGTGAPEEAVQHFQHVIDREPTNDEATLGLARAQARAGAAGDAEATYKRAIELRPQYWATHVWLGTFYREHARYAEAVREYEEAARITPDNARVFYVLCGMYGTGSLARYDDAIAACQRSAAIVPNAAAYQNWGAVLSNLRRFDEAIERFKDAQRVGGEDYTIDGNMARACFHAGKRAEAAALYRRAIALGDQALTIDPRDEEARISVAAFHAKIGDRARAIQHMNRLPADLVDPHVLLFGAIVYLDLGDRATALTWLERAKRGGLAPGELRDWIELDALKNEPRYAALFGK